VIYRLLYIIFRLLYLPFRLKKEGQKVPQEGAIVLASNHASYLDPVAVGIAAYPRRVNWVGKKELFSIPVLGWFLRSVGVFPVNRLGVSKEVLKKSIDILNQGKALIIFPQGTRVKDGVAENQYNGASYLATKTGAKVVPVAVIGSDKVIPEGKKLPRFPKITVKVGHEITVQKSADKQQLSVLTDKIMKEINILKEQK